MSLRAAPDHHGVGAGRRKRRVGIVKTFDVAVDDDRDGDCVLYRAYRHPIGAALVELAAGAAMHRNEPHAGCFRAPRQFGRVAQSIIPAEPHLQSDRHPHRADHRLDQSERMIEITHQRRAGLAAGDVARRTTHVDVKMAAPEFRQCARPPPSSEPRSRRAAPHAVPHHDPRSAAAPCAPALTARHRRAPRTPSFPRRPSRRPATPPIAGMARR